MVRSLRVSLYNETQSKAEPFRKPLEEVEGLEIAGECSSWQELQVSLSASPIDAVVVNLDTADGGTPTRLIRRVTEVAPQCGIIGVSANVDPDAIIGAMRAGCHQFVRWPIDPADLRSALDRVAQARMPVHSRSQTVGLIGASGGAGATTLACNLAIELAHLTELRVALVDMDLHYGDVTCAFDVTPQHSVADVCQAGVEVDRRILESAMTELPCRVSLLGRPEEIEKADQVSPDVVEQMFRVMSQLYPFVVVDLPRYLSPSARTALGCVDRVLIVSQLSVPHLRHATRIYGALLAWGAGEDQVEIVLNRHSPQFDLINTEEVEEHFRRPVFGVIPNDYKRIGASRDRGHPIMADSPNSPARLAIQELARRLAVEHLGEEELSPAKGGLLGIFRRRRGATTTR